MRTVTPPRHDVIPTYINSTTCSLLASYIEQYVNELPGLSVDSQVAMAKATMLKVVSECDALGYAFERLAAGTTDAVYVEGLPKFTGKTSVLHYRSLSFVLGSLNGSPFQYKQQHDGTIVPVLVPVADSAPNCNETGDHFGAHTDDAVVPYKHRVKYISLLGEINDSHAKTGYASIGKVLRLLDRQYRDALQMPWYQFKMPASFAELSERYEWSSLQPIIFEHHGQTVVQSPTYNTRYAVGSPALAQEAFTAFCEAVESCMEWFEITGGSYLCFRNDRGLHSREAIEKDLPRRVYRTYWHDDIEAIRESAGTKGNVFDLHNLLETTE